MPRKAILFQWTGWAPRAVAEGAGRAKQVSCAAVFPSKAAFMRETGRKQSDMPYVSYTEVAEGDYGNTGANLATENPGVVYWQDSVRNAPRTDVWLVHPEPVRS